MAFRFKDVFDNTQSMLGVDASQAAVTFQARSQLADGFRSNVAIRQFSVAVDEPPALAGQDTAPNPVEYILAALGSCQEITYRLYADALGIPLNSVSVRLSGDIDLRGFFNIDPKIRPGYQRIRAEVFIDSPAAEADIARLKKAVDRHCPVLDILRNPTPVELQLTTKAQRVAAE